MTAAATLVGRAEELRAVELLLELPSGPRALVVRGDAGIGKSALWEAGLALARSSRRVLACRPTAAEARLSFSALGDLLAPYVDDALRGLPTPQARALSAALLVDEPADASPEPRLVGVATLGALRALAALEPLLLAVDDGQWLDASSSSALAYALRRLDKDDVTVLETVRIPHAEPLGLDRSGPTWTVDMRVLAPLDVDALHAIVRSRLGVVVSRPTMLRVHAASAGNPLFAIELVRSLPTADGRVTTRELTVPSDLLAVMAGRIEGYDGQIREVLAAAASLTAPTLSLLEYAVPGATAAVATAERDDVVNLTHDRVRFTHPLLAAAALDSLTSLDRAALQRRLAASVDDREEQAHLLALSTVTPDEAVAALIEDAATICSARGAPAAAAQLLESSVRLTMPENESALARRKLAAATQEFAAGDWARARELFAELHAELPPGPERARALLESMVTVEYATVGLERSEQAIAEAGGDATILADAHRWLAQSWAYAGDVPRAVDSARKAVELARSTGDIELLLRCGGVLGRFETITGQVTPQLLEALVENELSSHRPSSPHDPSQILGERLLYADRLAEGRQLLERAFASSTETGDEPQRGILLLYLTQLEIRAGNWARADAHASELYELDAQLYGFVERTYFARALVDAHLGRADDVRELLARDVGESLGVPEATRWEQLLNRWVLGFVEISVGDYPRAAEHLRHLPATLEQWGYGNPGARPVLPDTIEALVGIGELDTARAWTAKLAAQARTLDNPWALATAARSRALLAAAEGSMDQALTELTAALIEHDRSENPFERARTLLLLGATSRRARRKRAARDALTEALETFDALGAALWAEKTSAELARIGGRRPSDGALTPTEREVAELVAQGKSNKEVAAALYVTVRTVETHVRHVYAKLGVHSRSELAARLNRGTRPE